MTSDISPRFRGRSATSRRTMVMAAAALAAVMGTTAAATDAAAAPRPDRSSSSADTTGDWRTRATQPKPYVTHLHAETFQLSAKPSQAEEQRRLKSSFQLSGAESTGLFLPPNRRVLADVADTPDSRAGKVKLRIGVPGAEGEGGNQRVLTLKPGTNRIGDETGGMLYLTVEGNSSATTSVELLGGMAKAPRFVLGETSSEEFRAMLDDAGAPWVEYVSKRAIVTVDRATALKYRDQNPERLMRLYDDIVRIQDGVNNVGEGRGFAPSPLRQHVVLDGLKKNGTAQAADGYMAFDPAHADVLLSPDKLSRGGTAWDVWRELSRPRQLKPMSGGGLSEAVGGIYAAQLDRLLGRFDVGFSVGLWSWHPNTLEKLRETNPSLESVRGAVMLDQLTLTYGRNYWSKVNDLILRGNPKNSRGAQDTLILTTSVIAGEDLRDFFAKSEIFASGSAGKVLDSLDLRKAKADPSTRGGKKKSSIMPLAE
ncbi:M60 family metallopeptidase [Streptomyces sp. NPDC001339]|uniref:M60 family metallopeptidase n=1 Tax=Streptomyces sp. NPDC001339 TaxID=3364563 RepID=UPI0036A1B2AF